MRSFAADDEERDRLWTARRLISMALRATGLLKINHDVVVPRGRVPELFAVVDDIREEYGLRVVAFGHAGDGNIHVNLMIDPADAEQRALAKTAERVLFERVVALEGSISGEHGIGFAKAPYIGIELLAGRDCADEARESGLRSKRHSEPGQDLSVAPIGVVSGFSRTYLFATRRTRSRSCSGSGEISVRSRTFAVLRYWTSPSRFVLMPAMDSRRGRSAARTTSSTRSGDRESRERGFHLIRSTCLTRV